MSRRAADANVEAGVQTRLHDRRQPPRREHAASAPTSIPDPKTSRLMEKAWASRKHWRSRGRGRGPRCEYPDHDVRYPNNTNTSSSSTQAEAVTHEASPTPMHSSPPILACFSFGWHIQFFIRTDHGGSFHTYPRLGGPFQSLQEAEDAIDGHFEDLRSNNVHTDGLPQEEIAVRYAIYWPDGTRKMSSKSNPKRTTVNLLVQALLDKYNEDHLLSGDLAYELDHVVIFREIYERKGSIVNMFYHINLATKTKGDDGFDSGVNNLFFAEVTRIKGEVVEYVLNCFCMVEPNDNGQCYGCMRHGNVDLKHPVDDNKFKGGHSRNSPGFGVNTGHDMPAYIQNEEDRLADEEARTRRICKCPNDPPTLVKLDGTRVPVWLAKREDGQGSGKYIVPARRQLV